MDFRGGTVLFKIRKPPLEIVNIAFPYPSKVCSLSIQTWFEEVLEILASVSLVVTRFVGEINKLLFVVFNNFRVNIIVAKMLNPP